MRCDAAQCGAFSVRGRIGCADILEPFVDKMVPEIIKIFKTNDGIWKMWVLANLTRHTESPFLLREIQRIAKSPTRDEVEDEANLEAIAILNGDYK